MPNNRLARGAKVLRDQILAKFPESHWNGHGEPDGLNVIRSIEFGDEAGEFLTKVLDHFQDERIAGHEVIDGKTVVHFVQSRKADLGDSFPLEAAEVVADLAIKTDEFKAGLPKSGEDDDEPVTPTPAKKAAAKPSK